MEALPTDGLTPFPLVAFERAWLPSGIDESLPDAALLAELGFTSTPPPLLSDVEPVPSHRQ
jgi:hypothetical protein